MKYLALVVRLAILVIGGYMMYNFPAMDKPPFVSGLALVLVALYLQLFTKSCCGCTSCIEKKDKKHKKDKKKHKKHKKDKYEGNF